MAKITIESLKQNGFYVDTENKEMDNIWLQKDIGNWAICYRIYNGDLSEFVIEADGGYDYSGSFDISHFKDIEQIDKLINAMKGL